MSVPGQPQSKRCQWCGERKPIGSFSAASRFSKCEECRYERKVIPSAKDPVRKRTCWYCSVEFVTTDFTSRLCSPACRSHYRSRLDHEPITAKDKAAITRGMKRLGLHRKSTDKVTA